MLCLCLHPFNVNNVRMRIANGVVTMRVTLEEMGIREWDVIDVETRGSQIAVSPYAEMIGNDLVRDNWKWRLLGQRGHNPGCFNSLNILMQVFCWLVWKAVMCS